MSSYTNSSSGFSSDFTRTSEVWEPSADYDDSSGQQWGRIWQPRQPSTGKPYLVTGHFDDNGRISSKDRDNNDENNSEDDSGGNPKSFKRVCAKFAERTSMQGIPYVYVSNAVYAKVLWVVIFLVGFVCMGAHLYLLIKDYYSFETTTQVTLGSSPLAFPAVTICNVNRIKKDKMRSVSDELRDFIESIKPSNIIDAMQDYRLNDPPPHMRRLNDPPPHMRRNQGLVPGDMPGPPSQSGMPPNSQQSGPPFGSPPSGSGPSPPSGNGRRKRSGTAGLVDMVSDTVKQLSVRVKRFITGFDVNSTSSNYLNTGGDVGDKVYTGNKTILRKIDDEFKFLYSLQSRRSRIQMGHQMSDMMVSCSFAGIECHAKDFELFQTAEYGNCYTLQKNNFLSVRGGPGDGLELILYLDEDNYMDGVTSSRAGIQLLVHEPNSMPFPYQKGFAVSASQETWIGLKLINVFRESKPYGDCVSSGHPKLAAAGIRYTRTTCQMLCLEDAVESACGCFYPFLEELNLRTNLDKRDYNNSNRDPTHLVCQSTAELECMDRVNILYLNDELNCQCDNPCVESEYRITQSSRTWPRDSYAMLLAEQLCNMNATNCENFQNQAPSTLRENFIKVTIYFEDLNFETITEKPAYETTQFISDVGGTIGLWIGLSIISIFEVFQFIFEAAKYALYDKPRQARNSKLKKKLQHSAREIGNAEVRRRHATSGHSAFGLSTSQMNQMRGFSTIDSPTNPHSYSGF